MRGFQSSLHFQDEFYKIDAHQLSIHIVKSKIWAQEAHPVKLLSESRHSKRPLPPENNKKKGKKQRALWLYTKTREWGFRVSRLRKVHTSKSRLSFLSNHFVPIGRRKQHLQIAWKSDTQSPRSPLCMIAIDSSRQFPSDVAKKKKMEVFFSLFCMSYSPTLFSRILFSGEDWLFTFCT